MKKLILLICAFFFLALNVKADVMPFYMSSIHHFGYGVVNVGEENTIYDNPNAESNVIATISYDINGVAFNNQRYQINRLLVAFSPRSYLAFAVVTDEHEGNWYKICYDQATGKEGWIKVEDRLNFFSWKDFYEYYGRKNGIYAFRDLPAEYKELYSGADESSQVLSKFEYARYIKLTKIMGNWALVTLTDLQNSSKIGWVRWRSDNGVLYYFPSIQKTF